MAQILEIRFILPIYVLVAYKLLKQMRKEFDEPVFLGFSH